MTKENREKAYKHFRDLEANYKAPDNLKVGLNSTEAVRKHAKNCADALLKKNPELADTDDGDISYSDRSKKDLMKLCDEEGLEYNSKSTKDDLVVLLENKSDEPEEVEEDGGE